MHESPLIRIGNQTAASAPELMVPFQYAVDHGFDAFEWFPDRNSLGIGWDESAIGQEARARIQETSLSRHMRLFVHAPLGANPLNEASQDALLRSFRLAHDLGAGLVNMHLFAENGIDDYIRAITPFVGRLSASEISVSIENTPLTTPQHFNELFGRLKDVRPAGFERVGMCLDLGHANLCAVTRNDYLRYLDLLDSDVPISHIHLHENWGDYDSHLPIFTGPSARGDAGVKGFIERILKRGFSGSIILEQWPQPPTLLDQARDRLRRMLGQSTAKRPGADGHLTTCGAALETPQQTAARPVSRNDNSPPPSRTDGEDALVRTLAEADRHHRSWREKLDFICSLMQNSDEWTTERLAYVAIYLRFLGTGEVRCAEDGRHFRPHRAAIASEGIQEQLARITTAENIGIVRKIYPWLPSSGRAFTRSEPLTRIRDIAHRNDIPQELKREIKETLQNKLHRCAGPEDLETSADILARITASGAEYPPDFVEQFATFHEELEEFFNARSLEDRLRAIAAEQTGEEADLIHQFLAQKQTMGEGIEKQIGVLQALTALRRRFVARVRNDGVSGGQALQLADIALEDFCFALLSSIANHFEGRVNAGREPMPSSPAGHNLAKSGTHKEPADGPARSGIQPPPLPPIIQALALTVANVSLGGFAPEECEAISSELEAWRQTAITTEHPILSEREDLLRLKATANRARRLADQYSDRVIALLPERVTRLGRALHVTENAIRNFVDGDIRGHLVFQLSRLIAILSRALKQRIALPRWETIVSGSVSGRLLTADFLATLREKSREPIIALLKDATGNEEIPKGVHGIILAREIPHLSHLAVRARQAGVVFATCDDGATLAPTEALVGKWVALQAGPQGVEIEAAAGAADPAESFSSSRCIRSKGELSTPERYQSGSITESNFSGARDKARGFELPEVWLHPERPYLPLDQVVSENGGAKAAAARKLWELSQRAVAGFKALSGFVVPFGVMEASLHSPGQQEHEYHRLVQGLDGLAPDDFRSTLKSLRELIAQLPLARAIIEAIAAGQTDDFQGPTDSASSIEGDPGSAPRLPLRLMVRSSANTEDLEGLAGAGLYDTVANVAPADLGSAIAKVWASLWTERAALSRRQQGIAHEQAHMAVLIQPMIVPEYSFIMHTVNPVSLNRQEAYVELVVGMGEMLASATAPGTPYRMVCNKESGDAQMLAFANFSHATWPDPARRLRQEIVDYSKVRFSREVELRNNIGRRLATISRLLEKSFGRAQDVEGVIKDQKIYLVQAPATAHILTAHRGFLSRRRCA